MRRNHYSPISGPLLRILLVLALLLFFAAFLYSCSTQPQMYSSRGYVLFIPASSAVSLPVTAPWP